LYSTTNEKLLQGKLAPILSLCTIIQELVLKTKESQENEITLVPLFNWNAKG
jgi:hypothetical protein